MEVSNICPAAIKDRMSFKKSELQFGCVVVAGGSQTVLNREIVVRVRGREEESEFPVLYVRMSGPGFIRFQFGSAHVTDAAREGPRFGLSL